MSSYDEVANWALPDTPKEGEKRCTWSKDVSPADWAKCPHTKSKPIQERPKILNNILEFIGQTPLVRLNNIPAKDGIPCEVLAKCEYLNPGGSVKDRIAYRMVLDAEESGRLQPGDSIIEPTSGNTGIGLAMCAAAKKYDCFICMPQKMSKEKENVLKGLGAKVIRTPTEAGFKDSDSHVMMTEKVLKSSENMHALDQYRNPGNPMAHYDGTAAEIVAQCDGKVDVVIAGSGTGGTVSGIARKLKEAIPSCKVVAIDPVGSMLSSIHVDEMTEGYDVEGIGYDFIPPVLDRSAIDHWIKSRDKPAFTMARRLIREEGLLVGGSSGTAMSAVKEVAEFYNLGPQHRIVVIFPDSVRNYLTKFLSDDWMYERGHMEPDSLFLAAHPWWSLICADVLDLQKLKIPKVLVDQVQTHGQALAKFLEMDAVSTRHDSLVGVVSFAGTPRLPPGPERLVGVISHRSLMQSATANSATPYNVLFESFVNASEAPLGRIVKMLQRGEDYVIIELGREEESGDPQRLSHGFAAITMIDVLPLLKA